MISKKILMLVRTSGLDYDDRIRKEILSLNALGFNVWVLANYTSNKSEKGVSQFGAPYKVYSLWTRKIFPSGKLLPLKMFEFWVRVFFDTIFKRFDFVWVHEEFMSLNILLKPVRGKYVFDLHELPKYLATNDFMIHVYHRIEEKSHKLVVANMDRLNYMSELGLIRHKEKYHILNNFPDKFFRVLPVMKLPETLKYFIGDFPYILLQGGGHATRYPIEALSAIKKHGKFKAVIVGPVAKEFEDIIKIDFQDTVHIAGYIKQLELPKYIDHAWASIILYGHINKNNIYCEPNRFYQALCRGIPVIVGNNPPMKSIVEETGAGVVIDTDGADVDAILNGIYKLERNYICFKQNAKLANSNYIWETQLEIIKNIVT